MAELLRGEIAQVLRREAQDPRLRLVTLTRVDVAPDLSQALVFWSRLDAEDAQPLGDVQQGLEAAAPFLRSRLARVLSLKRTPQLRFRYDASFVRGSETLSLLQEIADAEKS
jgi:ribosome-binding factor A